MARVRLVLADDFTPQDVDVVASEASAHGLQVTQKLSFGGAVVGNIPEDKIKELESLDKVQEVSVDHDIQLPPFDTAIPQ